MRVRIVVTAALLLTVICEPAGAAPLRDGLSPAAFADEITRLSALIASSTPAEAGDLSRTLPASWAVDARDQRFDVPTVWLRDRLHQARLKPDGWSDTRDQLAQQLEAVAREALALGTTPRPDASGSQASLQDVLARPEFRGLSRDTVMTRFRARLTEWFRRVWQRLGGDRVGVRDTARLFAWVVSFAALGVLIVWFVRSLQRSSAAGRFAADPPAASRRSAAAWARQALAAADPREAVRCAYRAAVCRLEDEGAWRIDDARTPREYVRLLPRDHARRPIVADVARRFEEVFFGGRDATPDDRAVLLGRLEDLGCLPAD